VVAILEGSIRKSGNQVRITAQLINGATDQHLWSKDYNFDLQDIFITQFAVAKAISEQFKLHIHRRLKGILPHLLP
jgi:adenylate cyclase